jgi:uncharacterized protein (DUF58 family)
MNKTTKKIILKSRKQVFGDMLGNNASIFNGQGFEFSELREYIYGDDIRKIDWKTTAKLGKPFVKIYKEERELNVVVASMMNGSVYFGTVRQKSEVIAEIVSILGFSAVKNSDLFSHMIYADRLYEKSKPSKKIFSVNKAVESLMEFSALGKEGDFNGFVDTLFERVKKRSLLFIISDFIGEIDLKLLSKKHDVFAVIVRDRFEENPDELGYLRLVDMESGRSFEGNIDGGTIHRYKHALYENDDRLYKQFRKNGIRFAKIYTDEDAYLKLYKRMR